MEQSSWSEKSNELDLCSGGNDRRGAAVREMAVDDFTEFVHTSSDRLLRTAWLLTGEERIAEELVQEAMTRVFVKWRRIRGDQPLAYAGRIIFNLNNDRWRRSKRETTSRLGAIPERPAADRHHDVDDRDLAVRLLEQLPKRQREVVILRHYAGLSEQETAATLGISIGTVKSTCHQGLSTLRAAINNTQDAS